jgi:hypothetical protein
MHLMLMLCRSLSEHEGREWSSEQIQKTALCLKNYGFGIENPMFNWGEISGMQLLQVHFPPTHYKHTVLHVTARIYAL